MNVSQASPPTWPQLRSCALAAGLSLVCACGWKLETRPAPDQAQTEPSAEGGEAVGSTTRAPAPNFSLPNDDGSFVSLDELIAAGKPAILVFYRGHW